ncbi:MAG: trypsin-like peptidase domain-containing protein [Opitutales bacterium]|jgi:serine protease Do
MKYSFALALALFTPLSASELSRIELSQGGVVEARILDERPDRLVVDLGFSVISIPRDSIASVREIDPDGSVAAVSRDNLFRVENNAPFLSVKELSQHVGDAVVTVTTPVGLGSGFIIHPAGYIVTNDHVVAGETKIGITVFEREKDGQLVKKQYENVRIIASSAEWDLALLKIEGADGTVFQTVPLGDSSALRQGQRVFAIGNPLGLERSVSEGIVSIHNRLIQGRLFIQATAQISPGNSGGPLFNMRGEVVGVNNMKVSGFGAEGLGFAIPSETLENFLNNRDTFAFDPRNPNSGFRYNSPPSLSNANDDK